ncbi:hypothetical protein J132_01248 [Termitomyces sp. J132]|nr:hypothetical protein H2248_007280 [Termitomyces sp. 'cryptogamus']KNZ78269.1 hypothetical protein J132_01248 [Termitomyces sp. J132]
MTTCVNQTNSHPPSPPSVACTEHEGTQIQPCTLREHCGVPSSVHAATPNPGGQHKGHIEPTVGMLPLKGRGVRIVSKPILELIRIYPHLNLSEFQNANGAGFFVSAKRSRRRIPVCSRTLNERRGVTLFIRFVPPNFGGQPQGHLQPTVGNLPRRRKAVVVPRVQLALDTATSPDHTKSKRFSASEELKVAV